MSNEQNFPQVGGPVLDNRGNFTQEWLAFLRALWNRTGGGPGISADDLAVLAALSGEKRPAQDDTSANLFALSLQRPFTPSAVPVEGIGFGFEVLGALTDNEQLGFASWPVDVTFTGLDPDSYLNAFPTSPATADAVFRIVDDTLTLLGSVTVLAGQTTGTLAWVTDPYIHPADTFLLVFGPTPADATLGNVNALVVGKAAS